jgi:hypothetical protein
MKIEGSGAPLFDSTQPFKEGAIKMAAPKTFKIKPKAIANANAAWQPPPLGWFPATLGEEVDALLAEWYGTRGLPIPPEEVGIGAVIDRQERERYAEELRIARVIAGEEPPVPLAAGEEETLEMKAARLAAAVGPKPEFGSKDFWAWTYRKKAAENAALAAKGLPPLPTAKEKAAAKAAKAAAKPAAK